MKLLSAGLILLILLSNIGYNHAQSLFNSFGADESSQILTWRTYKIANTYLFNTNLDAQIEAFDGIIKIKNNYDGKSIIADNSAFRDDNLFNFYFDQNVSDRIKFIVRQNWLYSADTRSIGINQLQKLNLIGGFEHKLLDQFDYTINGGTEFNEQSGIESWGPSLHAAGDLNNLRIDDFDIKARFYSELAKQNFNRINSDFLLGLNLSRLYDSYNSLLIDLSYATQQRDFFGSLQPIDRKIPIVESRYENKIEANVNFNFELTDGLYSRVDISAKNLNVDRSYDEYFIELESTGINRNLNELALNAQAAISYYYADILSIESTMSINARNEENRVNNRNRVAKEDEDNLRRLEFQRDNNASTNRLVSNLTLTPSSNDTIKLNHSVSLLRYDTPSDMNNDDRDEYNSIIDLSYSRRFSDEFNFNVTGKIQMNHFVYLKEQRSALNNWNRIYVINPSFSLLREKWGINPSIAVTANYTIYDFEGPESGIRSFSFRQLSYKDSLFFKLDNSISLQSKLNFRYFERGILFWDLFAELPETSNFEQFIKLMLISQLDEFISVGAGVRYFELEQKRIGTRIGQSYGNTQNQISIAPETVFRIEFSQGSYVSLIGWYEFQLTNNSAYKEIPNFFISTSINL